MTTNNDEMKRYDFIEGTEFEGLVSKAIDAAPGTVGMSDVSVHFFDSSRGSDAMMVADLWAFFDEKGDEGGEGGGEDSGSTESGSTESGSTESGSTESGSTESGGTEDSGSTEPEVVRPEETENTPAQEQVNQDLNTAVTDPEGGTKAYSAVVESINNISLPADAGRSATISGAVQNGATIVNEVSGTSRYITVTGTQDEPVDVNIISSGGTVYLRGEYNDIYLEGKQIGVSSSMYPNVHGTVSVADTDQPVTVNANFVGDECEVNYLGDEGLTIAEGVTGDTASDLTVYAPNASVTMTGKYDELTVTCSDNTLILKGNFHANKLTILKGNILVHGFDIADFVDELDAHDGCVISYLEYHVTQSDNSKLFNSSPAGGKIILDEDIEVTKGRQFSALASGKEVIDLNGHTLRCGDTRAETSNTGSFYLRNAVQLTIKDSVGGGVFENNHSDYLIWANGNNVVVNIESGEFRGYTHTLYAHTGTINVYGGTFKLLNADSVERDESGNLKFLLNCLDANYTNGTAHINVYGGKFYEFNPAVTYGEPGGPVSYVAEGYTVVESVEDGKKVYEVVPESELEPINDNGKEEPWD